MADHYTILGCPPTTRRQDIKRSYEDLALRYHPDKNLIDSTTAFQRVAEALEDLKYMNRRQTFDSKYYDDARSIAREQPARRAQAIQNSNQCLQWKAACTHRKRMCWGGKPARRQEDDKALPGEDHENELLFNRGCQVFPFTKLPPEVRNMILEFGLIKKGNKKPALLRAVRVNKVLYESALPIYYRNNMHSFSIMQNCPSTYLKLAIV